MEREYSSDTLESENLFTALKFSLSQLSPSDRASLALRTFAQIMVNIIDVISISAVGLFTVISISGSAAGSTKWLSDALNTMGVGASSALPWLGIGALVLFTVRTMSSVLILRSSLRFLGKKAAESATSLLNKISSLPIRAIDGIGSQEVSFSLTLGTNYLILGTLGSLVGLISDISLALVLTSLFFVYSPGVTSIAFIAGTLVIFVLTRATSARSRKLGFEMYRFEVRSRQFVQDFLNTFRESLVRGTQGWFKDSFQEVRTKMAYASGEATFLPNLSKYILEVSILFIAAIIGVAVFAFESPTNAASITAMFLASSSRLAPAMIRIQQGLLAVQSAIGQSQSTRKLIKNVSTLEPKNRENAKKTISFENKDSIRPQITFRNVTFSVPGHDHNLLNEVNLEIKFGEVVAITGKSGLGKSTLLDAVIGVVEPSLGEIRICGVPPNEFLNLYPGSVSYLPQEVWITAGSIRSNVILGLNEGIVTDYDIDEALTGSQLSAGFTDDSKNFQNYTLHEGGRNISGGQKQRLGFARAIVTQPKLLLLDEATSGLDETTESQLLEFLNKYRGRATILMVTHSKRVMKFADRVFELTEQKIHEISQNKLSS